MARSVWKSFWSIIAACGCLFLVRPMWHFSLTKPVSLRGRCSRTVGFLCQNLPEVVYTKRYFFSIQEFVAFFSAFFLLLQILILKERKKKKRKKEKEKREGWGEKKKQKKRDYNNKINCVLVSSFSGENNLHCALVQEATAQFPFFFSFFLLNFIFIFFEKKRKRSFF